MIPILIRSARITLGTLALLALAAAKSHAQGWTSAPGTGSISLGYQVTDVRNHLLGSTYNPRGFNVGRSRDLGQILGQSMNLSASYVLIPNLSLSSSVAWVGARYDGLRAESAILDDGKFHGTFQDASIGAAYTVSAAGLALTPSLSMTFPTHAYEHHGHAAPGSHNTSIGAGLSAGRSLDPWITNAFLAVSYAHGFVNNVHDWGLDGNRYGLSVGYFLLPQLNVRGYFSYFEVQDGIDWSSDDSSAELFDNFHDTAAKTLVRRAGGALNYQLGPSHSVFVDIGGVVSGKNTHDGVSWSTGTSWNFLSPFAR